MHTQDIYIPDYFRQFIESYFGGLGQSWLKEIPNLVAQYAHLWGLEVEDPFAGLSFNYVAPVRRKDGSLAVLKVGVPEPEQRSEILALDYFAGRGIVRLIECSIDDHIALVERLMPGVMLSTLFPERDEEATAIAAQIMRKLATPAPNESEDFPHIDDWASRGMAGLRSRFEGGTGPFPRDLVERAETLFQELGATNERKWLLHGDLHHMNILSSESHGGWLAIDPKGVIGDRAYEAAAFILNPNDNIHSIRQLRQLLRRRIEQLGELLGIERQRIHAWALAFSVLSAWWDYESSDSWRDTIALGEVIAEIKS